MRKFFKVTGLILLTAVIILLIVFYSNLRDKHPRYKADMKIISSDSSVLKAGFAAVTITPEVPDRWTDVNNNARYSTKEGDSYSDGNGNGRFDPVWIAGFGNRRAANGIHDDLWATTMVIDDRKTRIAIVALDAIGFMNNEVIEVRKQLPAEAGITYAIIASTHTHEGPDMLGLWGPSYFKSGIDTKYIDYVKSRIIWSITKAVEDLRPVRLEVSEDLTGAAGLVKDTREPEVFDSGLRVIRVVDSRNGTTAGSLVSWADHPETLWGKNLQITSDFPHYVREGVSNGIFSGDSLIKPGIGGITLYLNGAIGGLMTTHPSLAVKNPITGMEYSEPSFEKAEAQGIQLATLALKMCDNPQKIIEKAGINLITRTLTMPIDNKLFRLGAAIGIIKSGTAGWMKMRTEISAFTIGPLSFATFPGEVYPEIINGGIESRNEGDYYGESTALQPIREMMPGRFRFVIGLANDEIGYIIPRSQWDVKEPFAYGRKKAQYGEENSLGPITAELLHKNMTEIISELKTSGK